MRTLMTFENEEKTAENLAENLESPFEDCEYHERIIRDAKKLVSVGFTGAIYNYQCGDTTFWSNQKGDVTVSVSKGCINYN